MSKTRTESRGGRRVGYTDDAWDDDAWNDDAWDDGGRGGERQSVRVRAREKRDRYLDR